VATLREAATLVTGKDYKDKSESPLGAWTAATSFQSMGLFTEAAEFDEAILSSADREHPHYQKFEHAKDAGYNAVLLRIPDLAKVDREELRDLVAGAWLTRAQKRVAKTWLAEQGIDEVP